MRLNNRNASWLRQILCVSVFALSALCAQAQHKTISGVVKDATGETIISASVIVKGTTVGTVTDFDGNYKLDVPADAQTLVVSYIGMATQEVPIKGSVVNVTLKEDAKVLDEVVVTGYGTTKKRDLVTSVASVGADQLKDVPVTTAAEALQGKLSGVSVTTTEGSPDADVKIRVRGGTSLTQSSDPLYIVDGFPVSSISDIAPSDIQSMDVLKDAAATAIYGAQGANGVIIITTKDSGSEGDNNSISVDYTGYIGWKKMAKKYEMLDNRDFTLLQYENAYLSKGASNLNTNFNAYFDQAYVDNNTVITPISDLLNYWGNQPMTDWQDETFGNIGFNSNQSVSVAGGNKNANFNMAYNRIDDNAIMYGSDYTRNNLSFKSKFKPIKNLTLGVTVRYSNTTVLGAGTNTAQDAGSKSESRVRNAIAYTPIELLSKDVDSKLDDEDSFGSLYNPITTIDDNYRKKLDNKWTLNGYAAYKFAKAFTVKTEWGYESRNQTQDRFYGPTTYYSRAGDGYTYSGAAYNTSSVICTDEKTSKFKNTNTLNYEKKFKGQHNLSILLGEETIVNKGLLNTFYGFGYSKMFAGDEIFSHLADANAANKDNATKFIYKNYIDPTDNLMSFFGRANYDFRGRYYLTATMRADGSTRFSQGNQWGYFPSVAAAWRMSDEDWLSNASEWLSNLKLRLSYGTAGNYNVDLGYIHFDYLTSAAGYMDGFSTMLTCGGADKIAPNNNLKWETTITRDFGIDYGFFNERLSGAFDIYWNNTRDLILQYKLASGGYNYQFRNIGSTENKGLEFSVRGVILDKRSSSLSYGLTVDANISVNRNKVVDLGGMSEYNISTSCFSSNYLNTDYEFQLTEGQAIGNIYGYQSQGWYTTDDFASYRPSDDTWLDANGNKITTSLGVARPGLLKLKDQNNDGTITAADRVVLGNTLPKFTGGFSVNGFVGGKWGRIDMNANFTYSYGNDVLNLSAMDYSTIFDKSKLRNNTANVAYGQRYSLFEADGTYIPATATVSAGLVQGDDYTALANTLTQKNSSASIYNPVMTNIALTDQYVEDASYLRLSSLTLGYSLPEKWLKASHIRTARVFLTGSNLFCLTKYSGSDPEVDTRSKNNPLAVGVDFSAYPKSRGINMGINLSF